LLVLSPARHRGAAGAASASSVASRAGTVTPAARGRIQASYAALPLAFEQNQGQTDAQVKYMARGDGYTLFLTANDAVFSLHSHSTESATSATRRGAELGAKNSGRRSAKNDSTAVVRMHLAGGNSLAKVSASGPLPGRSNYFLGNDPGKWRTDVPHYARVSYQDVYPGVNLAFHGAQRQTEFDFVVAPGASPAPIGFHFTGNQGMKTDDSGNLIISSAAGDVLLHKPVAYQEQNSARQPVEASFVLKAGNQVTFELGNYDRSRELVIDPSVAVTYASYLGGTGNDAAYAIAFDNSGAAYVTGQTSSPNFPHTAGSLLGTANAFVTKVAPDGTTLDYSTYIGGTGSMGDSGNAIAVNPTSGVAFVAGGTSSINFPVTSPVYQSSLKGAINAFVLELNSSGVVTHSSFLGGTGSDEALGIALASDGSGDVIVVGRTSSSDFPLSAAPLQAHVSGSVESGFVTKLNSTFTSPLVYSTYLGGSSNNDAVSAVAVDLSDNVYVTGQTFSTSFPTKNPFQATCHSCTSANSNAFVAEINPTGSAFVYSTYLGGSSVDFGNGIAVDSASNAYVTGSASSSDFPVSSGTYQGTNKGLSDVFVTKLNSGGSALGYSTFIGGTGVDAGAAIALDSNNNAYVTGQTGSSDFPTASATQPTYKSGVSDAFVAELNSSGSQLIFSTFLGGTGEEDPGDLGGIAVDSAGANIYVTGSTASTDFPSTSGVFQGSAGGGATTNTDAFVVKYSQATSPSFSLSATAFTPSTVSPGGMATSTVTVIPNNGFSASATVTLTCTISGPAGAVHVPTCAAASATAAAPGTLTVNTTAATALLRHPANGRSSGLFYAMFLPIGGIALLGFGSRGLGRKKLFGFLLIGLLLSGLILMPACGGGSGGHTGSPGTTAGAYTVTVSGTASGATQTGASPSLTLTVN